MNELEAFEAALEVMPDAVIVVAADGEIVAANQRTAELTGYPREELLGASVESLVPEAFARAHEAHRAEYFRAARARPMGSHLDIKVLRKDGGETPADIALSPLELDGRRLALAAIRDISDRRRMEEQLRQSEERQRLLIDGVTDYAIFMLDPEGRITTWNRGAERMKGYSAEEILGRHVSVFSPQARGAAEKADRELEIAASEGRFEEEAWRIRKDGSRFWANVVITPLRDDAGKLRGFAKITRDITAQRTARRQVEAALAVAQAILSGEGTAQVLELATARARRLLDAQLAMVLEPEADDTLAVTVADGARAAKLLGTLLDDGGRSLGRRVLESGRAVLLDGGRRNGTVAGLNSAVGVPLTRGGQVFGVLVAGNAPSGPRLTQADVPALTFLATQASLALEHTRIQEELQRLALVDERERIGRELHDGAIQAIFAIGMSLEGLAARTGDAELARRLRETVAQLDSVIKDLRNYIYGLRPNLVAEQHLEQALRQLVADFANRSDVTAVADIEPEAAAALGAHAGEVVMLASEALSNVGRHAGALTARLTMRADGDRLVLEIEDDGRGFDPARRRPGGQGLDNLKDRAARLGGDLEIDSEPGEGTTVRVKLPVP